MRTWTKIAAVLLLAIPLTASPLRAQTETNLKKIEKLQEDVKKLQQDVDKLQQITINNTLSGVATVEQLGKIREILERMAKEQQAITRQAGFDARSVNPPMPGVTVPTTGRIVVENTLLSAAWVRINGQAYRVEPGQTRSINGVPVGTFQYSVDVDNFGPTEAMPRTDALPPSGYRIRIFPR